MIPQKEMHNQREKIQKFLNYIEIKLKLVVVIIAQKQSQVIQEDRNNLNDL